MRLLAWLWIGWAAATASTGAAARAEVLDRVAISVGNSVITEADLLRDLRLSAFLSGKEPDLSPASRRKAADRLIERAIIRREIEFSRYPPPSPQEVAQELADFRQRHYPDDGPWRAELARRDITEDEVRRQFLDQLTLLRFVEVRFRPAVQLPDRDVERYYREEFQTAWRKQHGDRPPPSLDECRRQIEEILTEAQVDRALDRWMGEVRTQTRIRFRAEVFR